MTIGEKIRRLRKEKDLTQEELGLTIGVQKAAINKYETGTVTNPKRSTIQRLADVLNVDTFWLMDDTQDWPPKPKQHSGIPEEKPIFEPEPVEELTPEQEKASREFAKVLQLLFRRWKEFNLEEQQTATKIIDVMSEYYLGPQ